jgi:hypothetical protein
MSFPKVLVKLGGYGYEYNGVSWLESNPIDDESWSEVMLTGDLAKHVGSRRLFGQNLEVFQSSKSKRTFWAITTQAARAIFQAEFPLREK